jgi:hypothetical protein
MICEWIKKWWIDFTTHQYWPVTFRSIPYIIKAFFIWPQCKMSEKIERVDKSNARMMINYRDLNDSHTHSRSFLSNRRRDFLSKFTRAPWLSSFACRVYFFKLIIFTCTFFNYSLNFSCMPRSTANSSKKSFIVIPQKYVV